MKNNPFPPIYSVGWVWISKDCIIKVILCVNVCLCVTAQHKVWVQFAQDMTFHTQSVLWCLCSREISTHQLTAFLPTPASASPATRTLRWTLILMLSWAELETGAAVGKAWRWQGNDMGLFRHRLSEGMRGEVKPWDRCLTKGLGGKVKRASIHLKKPKAAAAREWFPWSTVGVKPARTATFCQGHKHPGPTGTASTFSSGLSGSTAHRQGYKNTQKM